MTGIFTGQNRVTATTVTRHQLTKAKSSTGRPPARPAQIQGLAGGRAGERGAGTQDESSLSHAGINRSRSQGLLSARLTADTPSDHSRLYWLWWAGQANAASRVALVAGRKRTRANTRCSGCRRCAQYTRGTSPDLLEAEACLPCPRSLSLERS